MRFVVAAVLLALAGCGNRIAEREALAGQYLGATEAELVRSAGVPARAVEAGGRRFLVYEERRLDVLPGPIMPGPWGFGRPYYGYGYGGMAPQAVEWLCETTFEVVGGKVSGFSLRGNACG